MPSSSHNNIWLHRFAVLTAVATLFLICVGGLVTSKGVGMSVPDWPTTYGYNMFFFPISKWAGGIFYEHSHRLVASVVGFLTLVLAFWLWRKEQRAWVRYLGGIALISVVIQGVLGGLRVTWLQDKLGIVHAALAQLFFVLICALAIFTSRHWQQRKISSYSDAPRLRIVFLAVTGLVFLQLMIGATMRHQHAGLAIPDFPLAYGKLWPNTDPESVVRYNQVRLETQALNPITAGGIILQMVHRAFAVIILLGIAAAAYFSKRAPGSVFAKLSFLWVALVLIQAALGAATIWTNKSADIATAHVAVGALTLMIGAVQTILAYTCLEGRSSICCVDRPETELEGELAGANV